VPESNLTKRLRQGTALPCRIIIATEGVLTPEVRCRQLLTSVRPNSKEDAHEKATASFN
jgi:hypothetical protein